MSLWLKARAVPTIGLTAVGSLVALLLPFSTLSATPSPGGAAIALALLLALAVPVVLGWGMAQSDRDLEALSIRPVALLDFALVLTAGVGVAAVDVLLRATLATPAGLIAGRAAATYVGLLLGAVPLVGWRNASTLPLIYFVAVAVAGRGTDAAHPAAWAWIASPEEEPMAMIAALLTLTAGAATYLRYRNRF